MWVQYKFMAGRGFVMKEQDFGAEIKCTFIIFEFAIFLGARLYQSFWHVFLSRFHQTLFFTFFKNQSIASLGTIRKVVHSGDHYIL